MDTFSAVADPTRRAMLDLLVKGERPAGDFVSAFSGISQPAVSKHLKVLREAGLVSVQVRAQQRIYSLRPEPLADLDAWVAKYKAFWPKQLDALEKHLSEDKGKNEHKK
ncbi:MAG: metalloregulator ArsR/SmtB family transcription factor [Nitrososphaera sp.]|jgi:DNA-binding transcriptional ArsR family regulator